MLFSNVFLLVFIHDLESDLVRVAVAVMKHHDQSNMDRKRFIGLSLSHRSSFSKEVSQDRKSNKAGTWQP